jgi:hypothetical protein
VRGLYVLRAGCARTEFQDGRGEALGDGTKFCDMLSATLDTHTSEPVASELVFRESLGASGQLMRRDQVLRESGHPVDR